MHILFDFYLIYGILLKQESREKMEKTRIINELPFLELLNEEEKEKLKEEGVLMVLPKGKRFECYKDNGIGLFYIDKGETRLYLYNESGRIITLYSLYNKEMCVLSASKSLKSISFEAEFILEEESTIFSIPSKFFNELMANNLKFKCYIYEQLAVKFSSVIETFESLLFEDVDHRLAEFILKKCGNTENKEIIFTQVEIAEAISSSREAIGRSLLKLKKKGFIDYSSKKVMIKNEEKLRSFWLNEIK